MSNICGAVFEETDGVWRTCILPEHSDDGHLSANYADFDEVNNEDSFWADLDIYETSDSDMDWED